MSENSVAGGLGRLGLIALGTCASFTLAHPSGPHVLSPSCRGWAPVDGETSSRRPTLFARALELADDLESMGRELGDAFGLELARRIVLTAADMRAIGATLERDLLLETRATGTALVEAWGADS